jgi:DNA-binding NarL/FixJ family response regulator
LFREGLALLLEWRTGSGIVQAGSLAEAKRVLGNPPATTVDMAIVEVDLRDEDGIEVIEKLRETEPHMPVLALAATRNPDRRDRAFRAGADEVFSVPEPNAIEELVRAARRLGGDAPRLPRARLPSGRT